MTWPWGLALDYKTPTTNTNEADIANSVSFRLDEGMTRSWGLDPDYKTAKRRLAQGGMAISLRNIVDGDGAAMTG